MGGRVRSETQPRELVTLPVDTGKGPRREVTR